MFICGFIAIIDILVGKSKTSYFIILTWTPGCHYLCCSWSIYLCYWEKTESGEGTAAVQNDDDNNDDATNEDDNNEKYNDGDTASNVAYDTAHDGDIANDDNNDDAAANDGDNDHDEV